MDNKAGHVLLVEDDESHAELVRRAFEANGSEKKLTVVGTLEKARKFLDLMTPELVIADLRLPDGKGIDLLPAGKEGVAYPVMVMTSHGDEQMAVEAMKAGALDYVVKTGETLANMAHLSERAVREWEAIIHRKEAEKLQIFQKEVLERIVAGESTIDILNALCGHVESMIPQAVCSIMVLQEPPGSLSVLAAPNADKSLCALLDGLMPGEQAASCGTAAYTSEPVFVSDTQVDPRWAPFRDLAKQYGILGCWSIPIFSEKKKVFGTFGISHPHPRSPTPFHQQLLELASYMAGITIQRREAEDRLRASEDQFRDLYDSAPLAYFSATPEGRLLMANSKTVELFGYSKEDLTGRPIFDLYAPTAEGQGRAMELAELVLGRKEMTGQELEMQRADGSRIWGNITIRLIRDAQGVPIEQRGIIKDITIRKQAERALQESHERLRALNIQLSAAEEAQRKRMARELHDQFGQTLTLLKFELADLADYFTKNGLTPSAPSFSDKFQSITALVDTNIQSVRNISSFLRPPILDDFGLLPALEWLGEDLQERTHLQCSVSIDPQLTHLSLNEAHTTTLFRIAQELLTNVVRHANASRVKLGFTIESNAFILDVCDNGQGIREESLSGSDSFGLRGIRERAWMLGGHFTIQGQPEKGTTATVCIPIDS